jgi:hypothetical protein
MVWQKNGNRPIKQGVPEWHDDGAMASEFCSSGEWETSVGGIQPGLLCCEKPGA